MNILVSSYSFSGNTKKISQAICEELKLNGHEVLELDLAEIKPDNFDGLDLAFLGSACHDADLAEPVKNLLEGIEEGLNFNLAGFVTHAAPMPDGTRRNNVLFVQWAGRCQETFLRITKEKALNFMGYFHCQGAPSPPIADFIHQEILPDDKEWEEYFEEVVQHPNEQDLEKARQFALAILMSEKGKHSQNVGYKFKMMKGDE